MEQPGTPTTQAPSDDAEPAVGVPSPPPPPPLPARPVSRQANPRWAVPVESGQLTPGWRIATAIVWGLVFVGYIAVWKTSRELGLNTWWLGPVGEPAGWWVSMIPFLAPVAMILLAVNNAKGLPWLGLGGAVIGAVVGILDAGKVPRLAAVELVIAAAGALAAVAGLSGRYRDADEPLASPADE